MFLDVFEAYLFSRFIGGPTTPDLGVAEIPAFA
jgi:hypothetical protein